MNRHFADLWTQDLMLAKCVKSKSQQLFRIFRLSRKKQVISPERVGYELTRWKLTDENNDYLSHDNEEKGPQTSKMDDQPAPCSSIFISSAK